MDTRLLPDQATNGFYAALPSPLRNQLRKVEKTMEVPAGTKLISLGVPLNQLLIINSGSVRIAIPGGLDMVNCEKGGKFSECGRSSGEAPEENVITEENCQVSFIPRNAFLAILQVHPQMYFAIAKILSNDLIVAQRLLKSSLGRAPRKKIIPLTAMN